jgi:4-hydroxy-2-oxoheptanedioate aldolase
LFGKYSKPKPNDTPLIPRRIPGHDHASIGFALDAGASLIIPQVDTVEQAREICAASKFGKQVGGTRSAPPFRWMAGLGDTPIDPSKTLWQNFNDQAALVIQIESQTGLDNLDAILTECGQHIDGVWLGLMDFRASLGLDGMWGSEPEYVEGVKRYEEILRKHDKPNTGVCLTDFSKGGNKAFVVVGGDGFTFSGEKAMLATARKNLPRLQYVKEVRNEI